MKRSRPLLGTFVTISAYGSDREQTQQAISQAFEEFHRADRLMSLHRADSELARVNELAATRPVPVSEELFHVLSTALDIARQTDGSFDITIRPLADLWGFIWKEYRLPTDEELKAVLPRVNYRLVQLDAGQRTVRFLRPDISIDLGGIGKGYAVDLAIEKLRCMGIKSAMVKAGGDLRVIGLPPGKPHWTVLLEDPAKAGHRTPVVLREGALSTSGNYENFFVIGGKRYAHLLDPRTGLPVEGIAACTVTAPTCMESDAWATACFVLGPEKSLARFGERFGIRFEMMPE